MARTDTGDSSFEPVLPNLALIAAGAVVLLFFAGFPVLGTIFFAFLLLIGNLVWRAGVLIFLSLLALPSHTAWNIIGVLIILGLFIGFIAFLARGEQPDSVEPRQTRELERYKTRQLARTEEIANFAQAVAHVHAQTTMSSREKQRLLIAQYRESRDRLQSAGQLTRKVDAEMQTSLEMALRSVGALPAEIGQSLLQLAQSFEPTGRRKTERSFRSWVEKHGFLWE